MKLRVLLITSFIVFVLVVASFGIEAKKVAKGVPPELSDAVYAGLELSGEGEDNIVEDEIKPIVKKTNVKPFGILTGFIEKEDESDARFVRIVLSHSQYGRLLNALDEDTIEEIRSIKENETNRVEALRQIKELVRARIATVEESIAGVMIIGKGREHENYRLVATEITNESASFTVFPIKASVAKTLPAPEVRGIWGRIFGRFWKPKATAPLVENDVNESEIDPENFEPIGELTITRTRYPSIEIDRGTLELYETDYEGTWDFVAFSHKRLPLYIQEA